MLAFPIDERDELPAGMPRLLGDVVICLERCAEQAADQDHTPGEELVVLAVHGTLHLLGYDHEHDDGAMLRAAGRAHATASAGWHGPGDPPQPAAAAALARAAAGARSQVADLVVQLRVRGRHLRAAHAAEHAHPLRARRRSC